jgi:hypothetical protein
MKQILRLITGLLLLAIVAACGGGGGGSGGCTGPSPGNCTALYTTAGSSIQILPGQSQTFTIGGGTPGYSVSSTGGAVTVSLSGTSFTITGSAGGGTASVVVTDSAGKTVTISVIVGTNAKFATTAGSAVTVAVGASTGPNPYVISGGSGVYFVSSGNTSVAIVGQSGSGNTFIIYGVANGTATVTAADNAGNSVSIAVTVGSGGASTVALYTSAPSTGVNFAVGGAPSTYKVGGGQAPYLASVGNTGVVTATVVGSSLTVTPVAAGTTTVNVTDNVGTSVLVNVTVTGSSGGGTVALYTTAPSGGLTMPIGTQTSFTIGGGTGSYSVLSGNTTVANVSSIGAGNMVTVTSVGAGSSNVTVTDSSGKQVNVVVTVTSTVPTSLYTTAPKTGLTFTVGGSGTYTIGGGNPAYNAATSNPGVATASVSGTTLTINAVALGSATVTITDTLGVQINIGVIVNNGSAGTTTLYTTAPSSGVNIPVSNQATYSIGGGTPPYAVTSSDVTVVAVSAVGTGNTYTLTGVGTGNAKVAIVDSTGAPQLLIPVSVSSTSVKLYTTAPSTGVSFLVGASGSYTIGGGTPPYVAVSSNAAVATTSVSGSTLTINGVAAGSATVTITDSQGNPLNVITAVTAPASTGTALYTTASKTGISMVSGAVVTYTVGGGTAPYTVSSSSVGVATVTGITATNTFTITAVAAGSANIVVVDASGTQIPVGVTVTSTAAVNLYTTVPTSGVTFAVGASGAFSVGGGAAPYSVTTSNSTVAIASISGTALTINAVAAGTATLAVIDSKGTQVPITVIVSNGPTVPLFTNAPVSGVTLTVPNTATYTIGGGTAPYLVSSSNTSAATVTVSGTSFTVTAVAAGIANIVVTDSAGNPVKIPFTISAGSVAQLNFIPISAVGNVGNTLNFNVYGGTPPYTLNANNLAIAKLTTSSSISSSGGGFSVALVGTGTGVITVLDSNGVANSLSIISNAASGALNVTPSAFLLGATSTQIIPLSVSNGSGAYSAYTSNLQLSSVTVSGSTVNVGLGTQGTRCLSNTLPNYNPSSGQYPVVITVVDQSSGASTTATMTIQQGTSCP